MSAYFKVLLPIKIIKATNTENIEIVMQDEQQFKTQRYLTEPSDQKGKICICEFYMESMR